MNQPCLSQVAACCALLAASLAATAAIADQPAMAAMDASTPHESAVWQKHEYSFVFMGFTSTYSCDGLASKLKQLLVTAGARPDAKASAGPCASPFGRPDKFARADLTFYTLAPPGAAGAADAPPADAIWKPVEFASRQPNYLALGDCELVDQFRTAVLPMFTTRNLSNHMTCVPHQESGSTIDLKFESLAPVPPPPKKG
jgi:hypothetical protein